MELSNSSSSSPTAIRKRKSDKLDTIRVSTPATSKTTHYKHSSLRVWWCFVRPYTIKGTSVSCACLLARALIENPTPVGWLLVLKALSLPFGLLCANIYTVAINQIYDVEIDRINKPYLPIAAGEISVELAWVLVVSLAVAGLSVVGLNCSPLNTAFYCLILFFGAAYSIPPFRLKGSTFGAIFSIAFIRGYLLNFGVYYSIKTIFGVAFQWSVPLIFITIFGTIMGSVVATVKDLSDVEGDIKYGVDTLASKLGLRNVAYLGSGLLLSLYGSAILAAICMPEAFRGNVVIPAHLVLAMYLIYQTRVLEKANYHKDAGFRFYMVIWNLYYAEYMLFPFI